MYMLKAMWMMPSCRNAPVTSRQYSPSATPIGPSNVTPDPMIPRSRTTSFPPRQVGMNSSTQMPIST
jgi:hypothetical protein